MIADGAVLGQGTPDEVSRSDDPYLKQFLNALPDGPVRFHFPGQPLERGAARQPYAFASFGMNFSATPLLQ